MAGWQELNLSENLIDLPRMYAYRLARIQGALQRRNVDALITYDPINTRYATGVRNMQPWALHTVVRMGFIPAQGKAVVLEYAGSEHLGEGLEGVGEVRSAIPLQFGPNLSRSQCDARLASWLAEVEAVAQRLCGDGRCVALDNKVPYVAGAVLAANGFSIQPGYGIIAEAQNIKNADEVRAMRRSLAVAEMGLARLQDSMRPGVSENALWAELNHTNIEHGGEYMDTRLLSSGPRTNPWYQECGERVIESGDMVSLDTDMIGPYGYDADISRSFVCEPHRASVRQKDLYRVAFDHVHHNIELVKPGATFEELSRHAFPVPQRYRPQTLAMNWHGVSLYGGWPTILGRGLFDQSSEDGELMPGMTLCVEAYVGEVGGVDGVKLEEQILVTETGSRLLSCFPFEQYLL